MREGRKSWEKRNFLGSSSLREGRKSWERRKFYNFVLVNLSALQKQKIGKAVLFSIYRKKIPYGNS